MERESEHDEDREAFGTRDIDRCETMQSDLVMQKNQGFQQ